MLISADDVNIFSENITIYGDTNGYIVQYGYGWDQSHNGSGLTSSVHLPVH